MRISDWMSDVGSSELQGDRAPIAREGPPAGRGSPAGGQVLRSLWCRHLADHPDGPRRAGHPVRALRSRARLPRARQRPAQRARKRGGPARSRHRARPLFRGPLPPERLCRSRAPRGLHRHRDAPARRCRAPPRPLPGSFRRRHAMTTYTVQCSYAAYHANTVEVEAESLDAALERAIERANGDPHWKALDHCGPTFVDAVAEGADADPWSGFGSALPIPARFPEAGEPPTVTEIGRAHV